MHGPTFFSLLKSANSCSKRHLWRFVLGAIDTLCLHHFVCFSRVSAFSFSFFFFNLPTASPAPMPLQQTFSFPCNHAPHLKYTFLKYIPINFQFFTWALDHRRSLHIIYTFPIKLLLTEYTLTHRNCLQTARLCILEVCVCDRFQGMFCQLCWPLWRLQHACTRGPK